ncbi:hypothetical protein Tco_1334747 [Tanacetum coccineum]
MARLPPSTQRHLWLRYEVEGYSKEIVQDYEQRLDTIFSRQVNRVHILDFAKLTVEMRHALTDRLRMVFTRAEGHVLFTIDTWRRLFKIWGPLVCGARRSMTWSMDEGTEVDVPYLLAQYLFRHAEGRKRGARLSGKHFVGYLIEHFGLVTEEGLQGLIVVVGELWIIGMDELVRLRICERLGDTLAWVVSGLERQQVAMAGAPEDVEGAHAEVKGVQADPVPV